MTDIFDSDVVWATAEGPEPGWWTLQPDSAAPKEFGRRVALSSLFWKVAIASGKAERMPACEPNLCVEEAPVWADLPADPAMRPLLLSRLLAEGTAQGGVVVQHLQPPFAGSIHETHVKHAAFVNGKIFDRNSRRFSTICR